MSAGPVDLLRGPRPAPERSVQEVAKELEAVFLGMVLEEMSKGLEEGDGLVPAGPGRDIYAGWLRTEMAKQWSAQGGFGLASAMTASLGQSETPQADTHRSEARVTSVYGPRLHPVTGAADFHRGMDVAAPLGSSVTTPYAGKVVEVKEHDHLGRTVVVEHPGGWRSLYGHTQESRVEVGQEVAAGQVIATVGQSGRATGPHLHFGLYHQGRPVDPSRWIDPKRLVLSVR